MLCLQHPFGLRLVQGVVLALAIVLGAPASAALERTLRFAVSLDDRTIGEHRFLIRDGVRDDAQASLAAAALPSGLARSVEIEADFLVRLLRIPVYRYAHRNRERWDNGCLSQLESETNANGERYRVALQRTDNGYRISTALRQQYHDAACLLSFAYWDPAIIGARQLVNAQTGAVVDVRVAAVDASALDWLDPGWGDVRGFRIEAVDDGDGAPIDIRIYYTGDWQWVGLESPVNGGRWMRYRRID
jgi:hypothetical protein